MSPAVFWESTPAEVYAGFLALDGKKWNGAKNMTQVLADLEEKNGKPDGR